MINGIYRMNITFNSRPQLTCLIEYTHRLFISFIISIFI